MLDALRTRSQSILIYLIFAAIIAVFVLNFGPGGGSCGGPTSEYAAKVNGEVIRRQEFSALFNQQLDYRRRTAQLTGGQFSVEAAERSGLRRHVIDQMIDNKLLAQEARSRGLAIADAELLAYLEKNYRINDVSFQDYELWVTRNFEMSVARFEQNVRNEILAERMERIIRDNVAVSDEELKRTYEREHDRTMVTFVKFDTNDFAATAPRPSDAAIDELLAKEMPAVEERYQRDLFKYRTPQQVQVRHILKQLPAAASEADVAQARGKLLELQQQIESGADFAALAKLQSDDAATKDQGGDLGWIKRGQMARALVDAVIDLKKDQMPKEPVRTPQGLHLLQVTDVRPPERQELEAVKRDVAVTVLHDRASDVATRAAAEAFLAAVRSGKKLEELTQTAEEYRSAEESEQKPSGKPVRAETPWILRSQEAVPRIGASKELHEAIFSLSAEQPLVKQPYKVGRSWYVVALKERELPDLAKFDSEKEQLRQEAVQVRSAAIYQAWLEHLRQQSKVVLNPELFPAAEENGLPATTLPMQPSAAF